MNKSDVETVIRCILTSSKTPIKILDLKEMFKNVTGLEVPLFEHPSLKDFLLSIPETVKLTGTEQNLLVNLVKNEKSNHIASLVKKQKNTQTKKNEFFSTNINTRNNRPFQITDLTDDYKLHQHLLNYPDGCSFEDITNILPKLKSWSGPLKQYNVSSFIKSHPHCIYFNGKFYALEVFKMKILNNDSIFND